MAEQAESILRGISLAAAILIASSATAMVHAAENSGTAPHADSAPPAPSQAAVEALRKSIAYHREARDLALKFSASVYNAALDNRDEYAGRLLLKGQDRFRLEIPGGVYVSDGKTYWEYHAKTKQAIRRDAADREGAPSPGDVLLRFLDSEPLSVSPVRENGKEWIGLRLDPARAMKNLDSLAVLLDKSTYALHQVSSRDVSGNEARYTVVSVKRNSGLKDGEFGFEPPKGVEVVDMRGE
jgi:chaperone LolA